MSDNEAAEWSRHYDSTLWAVTSIFLAANGALLVHSSQQSNFRWPLAVGGQFLTVLTIYFAASFRELRQVAVQELGADVSRIWEGRRLRQWWAFVILFMSLIAGWNWILNSYAPDGWAWWLATSSIAVVCTLLLALYSDNRFPFRGKSNKRIKQSSRPAQ